MPMIELTLPAGTLPQDVLEALTEELVTTLLRAEGAPDTDFFRSVSWAYVHQLPAGTLAVGGRPGGTVPRFRVDVTIPQGALTERRKEQLISEAHAAIARAAGLDPEQAGHVWTLIHEVPEGNWGAGGRVVRLSQLKGLASSEREQASA